MRFADMIEQEPGASAQQADRRLLQFCHATPPFSRLAVRVELGGGGANHAAQLCPCSASVSGRGAKPPDDRDKRDQLRDVERVVERAGIDRSILNHAV
jgi:hypothetical protein